MGGRGEFIPANPIAEPSQDDAGECTDDQKPHEISSQKARVPIAKATSMIMTAVHAAGEFPWPGSDSILIMLRFLSVHL